MLKLNNLPDRELSTLQYWLWLGSEITGFVILQLFLTPKTPLIYQEGLNLLLSRLTARGYLPYQEIFTLQSPLFVALMARLGKLSFSGSGYHLIFALFSIILLLGAAELARLFFGKLVALAATLAMLSSVTLMVQGTAALATLPATSLATLSLVCTLYFFPTKKRGWLVIGGGGWMLAWWMAGSMFSMAIVSLLILMLIPVQARSITATAMNVAAWLLGALVVWGVGAALFSPEVVGMYLANWRQVYQTAPLTQADNFQVIGQFLALNIGLVLAAIYAVVRVYKKINHFVWLMILWITVTAAGLMFQPGVSLPQANILLPPVAVMAGWGMVDAWRQAKGWLNKRFPAAEQKQRRQAGALISLAIFLITVGFTWHQWNALAFWDIDTENDLLQFNQRPEMIAFVQNHTAATECVIADDPTFLIEAQRLPPPQLANLSPLRVESGLLTQEQLQKGVAEANCSTVVFYKRHLHRHLDNFKDWANTYFPDTQKFEGTKIFFK